MTSHFYSLLVLAVVATGAAILAVGFSRLWKDDAKRFLRDLFGTSPNDDDLAEQARQDSAKLWLAVAAVAWLLVSLAYRFPS